MRYLGKRLAATLVGRVGMIGTAPAAARRMVILGLVLVSVLVVWPGGSARAASLTVAASCSASTVEPVEAGADCRTGKVDCPAGDECLAFTLGAAATTIGFGSDVMVTADTFSETPGSGFTETSSQCTGNGDGCDVSSGEATMLGPGSFVGACAADEAVQLGELSVHCNLFFEITHWAPSIDTTLANAAIPLGASTSDSAAFANASTSPTPTGAVDYRYYGSLSACQDDVNAFPIDQPFFGTDVGSVDLTESGGVPDSGSVQFPTAGTYYWAAFYSGDGNNSPAAGECELQTVLAAPSISTSLFTGVITAGGLDSDTASLSNASPSAPPGGTVDYRYYASEADCQSDVGAFPGASPSEGTDVNTVDLSENGGSVPVSASVSFPTAGTYYWAAFYSGDSNNEPAASGCEKLDVQAPTSLTGTAGGSVALGGGGMLSDSAMLSGGSNPGGTITFYLFAPGVTPLPDDTNNVYSDSLSVSGTGIYTTAFGANPGGYLPAATGTYQWLAVYSGDDTDTSSGTAFGSDPQTVTAGTPSIGTNSQPGTASAGSPLTDKATITGGFNPTGTVTFDLYSSPTLQNATTLLFSDTEPLSGGTATSASYTAAATGTDYWVATYNGDSHNNAVTSGGTAEPVTITPATPSISTSPQPATAKWESPIADKATVSGGFNPSGTVTFNLYSSVTVQNASTLLFTNTEPLLGGTATSGSYTAAATGIDYWVATYNGDSNNKPVTSGAALEPVTIAYSKTVTSTSGALTVTSGQSVLIAPGTRISGPVSVQAGGSLDIESATIGGALGVGSGAGSIKSCGSTFGGPATITGATGQVTFGDSGSCAGNTIKGNAQITLGTGTGVTFERNTVFGSLTITHNKGTITVGTGTNANKVSGNTITTPNP
jgi:hypothetical protein